jgi:hypothetical protein
MTSKLWTEQEIEILKKMISANYGMDKILKVLKSRTQSGVEHKAAYLGLSLVSKPEIDFDAFEKLMKQGGQKCI